MSRAKCSALICFLMLITALSLNSCASGGSSGFSITLVDTGAAVLTDEDVAEYNWDTHRIHLSDAGVARWAKLTSQPKPREPRDYWSKNLAAREFSLTINGVEMYRGHFSSLLSSKIGTGVVMYDSSGVRWDEVWFTFTQVAGVQTEDPRQREEIRKYFESLGKLSERR